MFVPKIVYEKAPFYWIILGVLLIVTGTYYGKAGDPVYFFAGIGGGAIACFWGLFVFSRRLSQESRKPCATYDEYLDQTCELNMRNIHPAKSGEAQD